jgi:hypothetical protein
VIVEDLEYHIAWGAFVPGASFFVPCLDAPAAKKVVREAVKAKGFEFAMKLVVEDGVQGLRIWRM